MYHWKVIHSPAIHWEQSQLLHRGTISSYADRWGWIKVNIVCCLCCVRRKQYAVSGCDRPNIAFYCGVSQFDHLLGRAGRGLWAVCGCREGGARDDKVRGAGKENKWVMKWDAMGTWTDHTWNSRFLKNNTQVQQLIKISVIYYSLQIEERFTLLQ